MTLSGDVIYIVNDQDEIIFANDAWDRFAQANAGEGLTTWNILHRPLWDFVTDGSTRELYLQILERVRGGGSIRFKLRCDSPGCRRWLEMEISRRSDATVEFRTRTLSEEEREAVRLFSGDVARSDELLRVCGWCKRVFVGDSWEEVEVAVERLQLFERELLPSLTHGICEACYRNIFGSMASS